MNGNRKAIIIGAGPAGLAAAYQLLKNSDIKPIIFERENQVGGLSKTIRYKGYRFDIGPHRFFSKSDRVNSLWFEIFPKNKENGFLKVNRLTRILYLGKFFDYPLNLSLQTLINLGAIRVIKAAVSYCYCCVMPIKPEKTLADFFTNRFGGYLYRTFFRDYTEKVWGVKCEDIPADWGVQRVKGLSIIQAVIHACKKIFIKNKNFKTETSLVESFIYPAYGTGQMYETLAERIKELGGEIMVGHEVIGLEREGYAATHLIVKDLNGGATKKIRGDYFISSMPIKNLIASFIESVPDDVKYIADNLVYRDYIIAALLFKKFLTVNGPLKDNWLYIQEPNIKMARLDIFNNFSPELLARKEFVWLGAEYFANRGDDLWVKTDAELKNLAVAELREMNLIDPNDLLDYTVLRVEKAYPSYFGSYKNLSVVKEWINKFDNLYLIGRNGMHRYNNMDHSILCGMVAADLIMNGDKDKERLWQINTEKEYHEVKKL